MLCTGSVKSSLTAALMKSLNVFDFASESVLSFAIQLVRPDPSRKGKRGGGFALFQNPTATNLAHTPIVMTSPFP
jgi:hypothetical protein